MSNQQVLDLLTGSAPLPKIAAASPQGVTVTQWTVGYDTKNNLTAQCLVTPDSGVAISLCTIAVYTQGYGAIIAAGSGGLNEWKQPGVSTVWGASAITAFYPQGKGTVVTCRILGVCTYGEGVYLFDKDFQL